MKWGQTTTRPDEFKWDEIVGGDVSMLDVIWTGGGGASAVQFFDTPLQPISLIVELRPRTAPSHRIW